MNIGLIEVIVCLFFTCSGGIIGILTYRKNTKKDEKEQMRYDNNINAEQIRHDTKIDVKLDNIAKNVDETRLDIKDFNKTINGLSERVSRVEQSTKQAHKRIDSLEELHLTK